MHDLPSTVGAPEGAIFAAESRFHRRRSRGFTLLEVLVALAVLAVALAAVIEAGSGYAGNQAWLRDRSMAHWVARNTLVRRQLEGDWPETGERSGSVEWGGREWEWRLKVSKTPDRDLRRLDVETRPLDADGPPLAVLSGFMERPR